MYQSISTSNMQIQLLEAKEGTTTYSLKKGIQLHNSIEVLCLKD